MDFVSNGPQGAPAHTPQGHKQTTVKSSAKTNGKGMRILSAIVLIFATLIIALLALYLGLGGDKGEEKYVDQDKYQAVFLNGGQVYFGKIRSLNSKYVTLDNIYYLRVNQQVQPNQTNNTNQQAAQQDVSLAKLGCELHGPTDAMVINREQVLFWENLKDDGQVVTAVKKFVEANPQGQKCDAPAANTSTEDK